jgi:nitrate reductase NapE component
VIAVGRDAAKRAVDQLLSGDDKIAVKEEKPEEAKSRRWKTIALVVLGLFLVVGVVGLLLHYWMYFLLAGALGVAGLIGWSRLRKPRSAAEPLKESEKEHALPVEKARVSAKVDPEVAALSLAKKRAEAELKAQELVEAEATREHELDEELAAMKARLKK